MRKLIVICSLLLFSFSAHSATINIDPGLALAGDSGPFGFGGRGVVFRAEQNFSMSSFGMDLRFNGVLDFHVSVYANDGPARGALISETAYPGMVDDNSEFFTLAHSQDFIAGTTYEIIMRFSDPGVIFPHYEFSNSSLDPLNGFAAGSEMLILDGSDFDEGLLGNSWLARFQIDTGAAVAPMLPAQGIPAVSSPGLMALIMLMLTVAAWKLRFVVLRR